MKRQGGYPYTSNEEKDTYWFTSVGPRGEIEKIVQFQAPRSGPWNLAFGDVRTADDYDDAAVSDNGDMRKVLQTITNIVYDFTDAYPERKIRIVPVDRGRKLVYNRLFQEKWEEIFADFSLKGAVFGERELENYDRRKIYDAFVLSRKKSIFEE